MPCPVQGLQPQLQVCCVLCAPGSRPDERGREAWPAPLQGSFTVGPDTKLETRLALAGVLVCRLVMVSAGVVAQALACVGHSSKEQALAPGRIGGSQEDTSVFPRRYEPPLTAAAGLLRPW